MPIFYFDHNIYIYSLTNEDLRNKLQTLSKEKYKCIYSPAHIEEIFKASSENDSYEPREDLLSIISAVTSNQEALPQSPPNQAIIIRTENPSDCYRRVASFDSTDRVTSDSSARLKDDQMHYKPLMKEVKEYRNISNISPLKIFDYDLVKSNIDELNQNIETEINKYNMNRENLILSMIGCCKKLPDDFRFEKNRYALMINDHTQLEYTIEILFRVLNYCGYNAEKMEKTAISGTHDVSHAIYATAADYLFTTDTHFALKCQAVYSFLGIKTKILYQSNVSLASRINDLCIECSQVPFLFCSKDIP